MPKQNIIHYFCIYLRKMSTTARLWVCQRSDFLMSIPNIFRLMHHCLDVTCFNEYCTLQIYFLLLWNIQYLNEPVHTISIPLIVIILVEVKVLCTLILLLNFYEYLCLNYYQLYCLRILSFTSFSLWLFINQWENKERPVFVYIVNISVCNMSYAFS